MTQACSDVLRDTRGAQAAVFVENNREAIELLELVARALLNFSQLKSTAVESQRLLQIVDLQHQLEQASHPAS